MKYGILKVKNAHTGEVVGIELSSLAAKEILESEDILRVVDYLIKTYATQGFLTKKKVKKNGKVNEHRVLWPAFAIAEVIFEPGELYLSFEKKAQKDAEDIEHEEEKAELDITNESNVDISLN